MPDPHLDTVAQELAPTGTLRVAINFGNPVLAQKNSVTGAAGGVSVELARELGRRLGIDVQLVEFDAAGKVFDAMRGNAWDLAFLAIDPKRAAAIAFTAPYVIIEGTYMVPADSPLRSIADVDRPGVRIAVGNGSAYELYLSRTIQNATIVRAPTGREAIELFLREGLDVVAGVKSPLVEYARSRPTLRVMEGRFMVIEQAVGIPHGRPTAHHYLGAFVEDAKASGFVAAALERSGQRDALVAPRAG